MVKQSRDKPKIRVGILGKGSIAIILGHYLLRSGCSNITYLVRKLSSFNSTQTIKIKQQAEDTNAHELNAVVSASSSIQSQCFDIIFLPIKCYQVEDFCNQYSSSITDSTVLFLLQNGMGGAQRLRKYFQNNPILVGITTDAGFKTSAFECQQTAIGRLDFGWYKAPKTEQNKQLTDFISTSHPNAMVHNEIEWPLYQKLAINAVINSLCSIKDVRNGELIHYPKDIDALFHEVWIALVEITEGKIEHHTNKDKMLGTIIDVIKLTKNNSCSMREDLKAGRQTEIDGILGFLLDHTSNPNLTYLKDAYSKIKQLEINERT